MSEFELKYDDEHVIAISFGTGPSPDNPLEEELFIVMPAEACALSIDEVQSLYEYLGDVLYQWRPF